MALTGSEVFQVLGQTAAGNPAAETQQVTTAQVAALAGTGSTTTLITALNTVGAGTITAAGIVGKITKRGGTQTTAFTDTTDTAAAIIALLPSGAPVNTAFKYTYWNNTSYPATITGGTGVTVTGGAGTTTIPANSWAEFVVTYTAAATVTMVGFEAGSFLTTGTFTLSGTNIVTVSATALTTGSVVDYTLGTVGGTVGALPVIKTVTPGTGFTVAGTASDTSVYNYAITG